MPIYLIRNPLYAECQSSGGTDIVHLRFCSLTLKAPITTATDDRLEYCSIVFQRQQDLIFHVNPLLAGDSHETASLIF